MIAELIKKKKEIKVVLGRVPEISTFKFRVQRKVNVLRKMIQWLFFVNTPSFKSTIL